jgi:hypothetical protein
MPPFVVDASMALRWCFADEATPYSRGVLAALETTYAIVPALWPFEVANALALQNAGSVSPRTASLHSWRRYGGSRFRSKDGRSYGCGKRRYHLPASIG